MFLIDRILLVGGVLTLVSIWSSKFTGPIGVPVLVVYLLIGMLAGSEGLGGIEFEEYALAHTIGTVALAVILFDGGLRTSFQSVKAGWKPAAVLATVGVFATAVLTGVAAAYVLGVPLMYGLLLGSIVSSTDAAAVFLILKKQGLRLKGRLSAILEIESGSNDPMAVFLTLACIEIVRGNVEDGGTFLMLFLTQMGVGALVGVLVGRMGVTLINRISLDSPGLYPVLAGSLAMISFGLAAQLGGSGFLAVYLAGILMGSHDVVFRRGIYLFHDGLAWMSQIAMFVVLGLLVSPSALLDVAGPGLVVALCLTFLARPLTIFVSLLPFGLRFRELTFLSWVGLKGAVPIILATYPLMFDVQHGHLIFNVVFFVVLLSALFQGGSMSYVARKLGLDEGSMPEPYATLEISSLQHVDAEIVEYRITSGSPAAGRRVAEIPLPEGVIIAMVAREHQVVPPRGPTLLKAGDYIFVVHHRDLRSLMDRVFAGTNPSDAVLPCHRQFCLRGSTTLEQIEKFYGITLAEESGQLTLAEFLQQQLKPPFVLEDFVRSKNWLIGVRRLDGEEISTVYLTKETL
jgi:cell volume regulation protein A